MGKSSNPGNQGSPPKKKSNASRSGIRDTIIHIDKRSSRTATVCFLLGVVLQCVPWGASLMGVTYHPTLGLIVLLCSFALFAAAVTIAWKLHKGISIALVSIVVVVGIGVRFLPYKVKEQIPTKTNE